MLIIKYIFFDMRTIYIYIRAGSQLKSKVQIAIPIPVAEDKMAVIA